MQNELLFVKDELQSFKKICHRDRFRQRVKVHFANAEDMQKFSELIGKRVTLSTRKLHFAKKSNEDFSIPF